MSDHSTPSNDILSNEIAGLPVSEGSKRHIARLMKWRKHPVAIFWVVYIIGIMIALSGAFLLVESLRDLQQSDLAPSMSRMGLGNIFFGILLAFVARATIDRHRASLALVELIGHMKNRESET